MTVVDNPKLNVPITNELITCIELHMQNNGISKKQLSNSSNVSYPNIHAIIGSQRMEMRQSTATKLFVSLGIEPDDYINIINAHNRLNSTNSQRKWPAIQNIYGNNWYAKYPMNSPTLYDDDYVTADEETYTYTSNAFEMANVNNSNNVANVNANSPINTNNSVVDADIQMNTHKRVLAHFIIDRLSAEQYNALMNYMDYIIEHY
jgi:hypothetical protein